MSLFHVQYAPGQVITHYEDSLGWHIWTKKFIKCFLSENNWRQKSVSGTPSHFFSCCQNIFWAIFLDCASVVSGPAFSQVYRLSLIFYKRVIVGVVSLFDVRGIPTQCSGILTILAKPAWRTEPLSIHHSTTITAEVHDRWLLFEFKINCSC